MRDLLLREAFWLSHLERLELSTQPIETVHLRVGADYGQWEVLRLLRIDMPRVIDVRRLRIMDDNRYFGDRFPRIFPKVHDLAITTACFLPNIFLGNWHLRHLKVSYSGPSLVLLHSLLEEQSMSLESLQLSGQCNSDKYSFAQIDFPNLSHLVLVGENSYSILSIFRAPTLVHAKIVSRFDPQGSPLPMHVVDTFVSNSRSLDHFSTS